MARKKLLTHILHIFFNFFKIIFGSFFSSAGLTCGFICMGLGSGFEGLGPSWGHPGGGRGGRLRSSWRSLAASWERLGRALAVC